MAGRASESLAGVQVESRPGRRPERSQGRFVCTYCRMLQSLLVEGGGCGISKKAESTVDTWRVFFYEVLFVSGILSSSRLLVFSLFYRLLFRLKYFFFAFCRFLFRLFFSLFIVFSFVYFFSFICFICYFLREIMLFAKGGGYEARVLFLPFDFLLVYHSDSLNDR